ncbi:cytidylate kinase-like family protein [Blautia coccoides]|nr:MULTISPECIES: cytidylate kinase family protein [Blautia]MCB5873582.1 cytidylate kinase-like family protein [Blautia producta]MCQ4641552.1 cytidylate kinase-like family protein [Blautia coccoides]MCQ5124910.1 cytidylate kinase-like family protein [Blautia producta]
MEKGNKTRERYYNYYTGQKWGDLQNYDLMINSSKLSPETAIDLILGYIEKRDQK